MPVDLHKKYGVPSDVADLIVFDYDLAGGKGTIWTGQRSGGTYVGFSLELTGKAPYSNAFGSAGTCDGRSFLTGIGEDYIVDKIFAASRSVPSLPQTITSILKFASAHLGSGAIPTSIFKDLSDTLRALRADYRSDPQHMHHEDAWCSTAVDRLRRRIDGIDDPYHLIARRPNPDVEVFLKKLWRPLVASLARDMEAVRLNQNILVVVHPGSVFLSGRSQISEASFRETSANLFRDIQNADGLVIIDGSLSDGVPETIQALIRKKFQECERAGAPAMRVWGCDAGERPYAGWEQHGMPGTAVHDGQALAAAAISAQLHGVGSITVTGAWATQDNSSGCVCDVADVLRAALPDCAVIVSDHALYESMIDFGIEP